LRIYAGKKSFGKAAVEVLNVSVEFAEAVCNSGASEGEVRLTPLLFDRAGLALTKQLLELTQVLAESTAASSPTVNEQAATTHRLLCCVAGQLGDDRICAELLQPVRRCVCCTIVRVTKTVRTALFVPCRRLRPASQLCAATG
jgi:hypothetical protein